MDIKIAREVAARIWCDPEMAEIPMDPDKAEKIAQILASIKNPRRSLLNRWFDKTVVYGGQIWTCNKPVTWLDEEDPIEK